MVVVDEGPGGTRGRDLLLLAALKLTCDPRHEPRDLGVAARREDDGGGAPALSCSARPIVSSMPSVSESVASSSSSCRGLPLVMRKTPKKVNRQPPTNLMACSLVVRSKSR